MTWNWFESNFIIVGAVISVVALAVFVIWEMTDQHPVVNLRLFAYRNFRIGTWCWFWGTPGFFGINLILPQWLQTQMGYTATWAGLAVAPIGYPAGVDVAVLLANTRASSICACWRGWRSWRSA